MLGLPRLEIAAKPPRLKQTNPSVAQIFRVLSVKSENSEAPGQRKDRHLHKVRLQRLIKSSRRPFLLLIASSEVCSSIHRSSYEEYNGRKDDFRSPACCGRSLRRQPQGPWKLLPSGSSISPKKRAFAQQALTQAACSPTSAK